MRNRFLMSGMAVIIATGAIAAAQTPAPQTPAPQSREPAPTAQPAAAAQPPASMTLIGCLAREQDVPGRKPNVAERAGVLEDYILTSAAPADQQSPSATPRATGTSGSVTSSNISAMYKVEGIPDDRLKELVGKKVEVTGHVDAGEQRETRGTSGSVTPATPNDHMPEFEATAIREIPGSCTPVAAR